MSIYFDKHTTYKSTAEPTIEEEINGEEPLSEFGRGIGRIWSAKDICPFTASKGQNREAIEDPSR
jgi:hypothetical protein